MLGLGLRQEFSGKRLKGTAIELSNEASTGATQVAAHEFLKITYPTLDFLKAVEAVGPDSGRPVVVIGERGLGKSHLLAVLHHVASDPASASAWLKSWSDTLGDPAIGGIKLRQGMLVIGESLHRQRYKFLWDLLFDRHPHGERIRGKWDGMGDRKTDIPSDKLILELLQHTPVVLLLDDDVVAEPPVDVARDGHGSVPLDPVVEVESVVPAVPIAPPETALEEIDEAEPEPVVIAEPEQAVVAELEPAPAAIVPPPVVVEPEPVVVAEPEPAVVEEPEPAPAAVVPPPAVVEPEPVAPTPEPVLVAPPVVAPVKPVPPVAVPLPPAARYEPLEGVSGTQIMSAEQARAEGLVSEELHLIVDGRRHPISKRATTIGRSRDCDIVVHDSNASRQHAEIRHIGLDYFVVDANSTNGTIVNGQRIRRHALAHGDRILIGTTELVVEHSS